MTTAQFWERCARISVRCVLFLVLVVVNNMAMQPSPIGYGFLCGVAACWVFLHVRLLFDAIALYVSSQDIGHVSRFVERLATGTRSKQRNAMRFLELVLGGRFAGTRDWPLRWIGERGRAAHQRSVALWLVWWEQNKDELVWDSTIEQYVKASLARSIPKWSELLGRM